MKNIKNILNNTYINYDGRIQIDSDIMIISLWNKYIDLIALPGDVLPKIAPNDKEFFNDAFDNPFDAAQAASAGEYSWTDDYVYFDEGGFLMSFSHLDDNTCPIDLDRIDISSLIQELQELQDLDNQELQDLDRYVVQNIPRAIHDALQEV